MDTSRCRGIALALVGLAAPAVAQTLYVDVNGTPPGSGTQADPYTSIQTAIDNSAGGGTIEVAPGTYVGDLSVIQDVHLHSTAGPLATVIQSDGSCQIPGRAPEHRGRVSRRTRGEPSGDLQRWKLEAEELLGAGGD